MRGMNKCGMHRLKNKDDTILYCDLDDCDRRDLDTDVVNCLDASAYPQL